jgi:hypothetical protein
MRSDYRLSGLRSGAETKDEGGKVKITQVELFHQMGPAFHSKRICWLPAEHKWKVGMTVRLKGEDERIWTVGEIYSTQEHYEINRKWDVGGLG